MKINWNFPAGGGEGRCKTKTTFHGGSMDIFWNCTMLAKYMRKHMKISLGEEPLHSPRISSLRDIYQALKQQGIYPPLFMDTEVNKKFCFSLYHTRDFTVIPRYMLQLNPAISNSVDSKSLLFRGEAEFLWIYPNFGLLLQSFTISNFELPPISN